MSHTTVVQLVVAIFILRCTGVAVLGARMPGFSLPRSPNVSEDARPRKLRRLHMLSALAAVLCMAFLAAMSAIDHYLRTHPTGTPVAILTELERRAA